MKIHHFDNRRPGMLMFAPPDDKGGSTTETATPEGSAVSVPAVAAPNRTESTVIQPPPEPGTSRVLNATEALGLPKSPRDVMDEMAKNLQSKVNPNVIPLPKKPKVGEAKKPEQPKAGSAAATEPPVVKPVETVVKPAETTTPTAAAAPVVTPPETKVKINGKEYTTKELEEALAAKTTPPAPPAEPTTPAKGAKTKPGDKPAVAEPTPEETEARERVRAFVDKQVEALKLDDFGITLTDDDVDTIVAGGKESVATLGNILKRTIAAAQANSQQFTAAALNAQAERLKPIMEHHQRIQEYQAEAAILASAKDVAAHAQGRETLQKVADETREYYDLCQQLIAVDRANDAQKQFAHDYETLGAEDFNAALVRNTRKRLGLPEDGSTPTPTPPAPGETPLPPKPAAKTPPPPTGQTTRTPAPRRVGDQAEMARSLR